MGIRDKQGGLLLPRSALGDLGWWIKIQAERLLFWSAVILPVVYLSLLFARFDTTRELPLFFGLLGLHIVALIGGRSYRRATEP